MRSGIVSRLGVNQLAGMASSRSPVVPQITKLSVVGRRLRIDEIAVPTMVTRPEIIRNWRR